MATAEQRREKREADGEPRCAPLVLRQAHHSVPCTRPSRLEAARIAAELADTVFPNTHVRPRAVKPRGGALPAFRKRTRTAQPWRKYGRSDRRLRGSAKASVGERIWRIAAARELWFERPGFPVRTHRSRCHARGKVAYQNGNWPNIMPFGGRRQGASL